MDTLDLVAKLALGRVEKYPFDAEEVKEDVEVDYSSPIDFRFVLLLLVAADDPGGICAWSAFWLLVPAFHGSPLPDPLDCRRSSKELDLLGRGTTRGP